ncbi:TraM recognition domain-containing protein [Arthrobacter sp. H20]|uniref:type IV secretory system conjugative DNA transfer family protein n=1 Tax=Arthrobacter sp. H20 TaxID=1267981 RepID=UPI0004B88DC3|nr:TraM recognition domain-containing protein [Arthrobacter sp. H20]
MSAPNRKGGAGDFTEGILLFSILGLLAAVLGGAWVSAHWGSSMAGIAAPPVHPVELVAGIFKQEIPWPIESTFIAGGIGAAVLILAIGIVVLVVRSGGKKKRVDRAAQYMAKGKALLPLTRKGALKSAQRLGVSDSPGVPIGKAVISGQDLFGSWEDMHVDIWGPRTGKTTSRAIPAIVAAPGAVVVTSNKRDVADATRDVRAEHGDVWVFDPQGVAGEEPSWWWNPLSSVTDENKAGALAEHFATGTREPGARKDPFFDKHGPDLLTNLLLAAALDNRPITQIHGWLTDPSEDEAVGILRHHGYSMNADGLSSIMNYADKQRDGIYGTALGYVSCLTNRTVAAWVNPTGATRRPEFDPYEFMRGKNTLYSLSKEGSGSAGPLVTALTVATVEAAEAYAVLSPGGRLATPLVGVLDEAANVCRWNNLPDQYSHYGSRGIVLMTILQSYSQGVSVWGKEGMRKLWSASNVKVYGGGVAEPEFMTELSQFIGDYQYTGRTTSRGKNGRSTSVDPNRKERILEPDDLVSLERGRAIVFASGIRPVLIKTMPWMAGPDAEKIKASIAAHDPSNRAAPLVAATVGADSAPPNNWIQAAGRNE